MDRRVVPRSKDQTSSQFGVSQGGKVRPTKVGLRAIPVKVNALLDDGADGTFIRTSVAEKLGAVIDQGDLYASTMLDEDKVIPSGLVSIQLENLEGNLSRRIGARVRVRVRE
jgi:hypothetical protein